MNLSIARLSQATAETYYKSEFASRMNSYMTENGKMAGEWQGKLSSELGLNGAVDETTYIRLMRGEHPATGEQVVKHREPYINEEGKEITPVPAWDFSFSLPKSYSLAIAVGGDTRLLAVAEEANRAGIAALESYAQAWGGGRNPPISTGKLLVATFRHDTARPVNGTPNAQVHFHNIVPNMVLEHRTNAEGKFRSLNSRELYKVSSLGTIAARDVLISGARKLGYQIRIDEKTGAPELKGFTKEYLESESLRSKVIEEKLATLPDAGRQWMQIARLQTREAKLDLPEAELKAAWKAHGALYGNQAEKELAAAIERGPVPALKVLTAEKAVDFSQHRQAERKAVFEHYELVRDAIKHSNGTVGHDAIEAEVRKRVEQGSLLKTTHYRVHAPAARYKTPEQELREIETIEFMRKGINAVKPILRSVDLSEHPRLAGNPIRAQILEQALIMPHQTIAINGGAGTAKSTALAILTPYAEQAGFSVKGLAPTGKARNSMAEKGIDADTVQMHLAQSKTIDPATPHQKTLYLVDEASLLSTKVLHQFTKTMKPNDRLILIGDDAADPKKVGQHTAVEAGRPFQQLQQAGMPTAQFNRDYRQKTPELKLVVAHLRAGSVDKAAELLQNQGRVKEYASRQERFQAIADKFAEAPKETLVVSPDNKSRGEINTVIRETLQSKDLLKKEGFQVGLLKARDVTGMDRTAAANYRAGDVIQFQRGTKALGVEAKSYATVLQTDTHANHLTIQTDKGKVVQYDPSIYGRGVTLYQLKDQQMGVGERVQFTSASKQLGVSTRDTGTIRQLDLQGNITVELDRTGRMIPWNLRENRHLDYAYTSTSHSAQSMTVKNNLIHVDTGDARIKNLIGKTFGYVAGSRQERELHVFTDDTKRLANALRPDNQAQKAVAPEIMRRYQVEIAEQLGRKQHVEQSAGIQLGI